MNSETSPKRQTEHNLRPGSPGNWLARARAFGHADDGGMMIFSFFVFIVLLCMGGISVDLMRHEMERTKIQNTLDGAVLAAAGAPGDYTEAEIQDMVTDFFTKSGRADSLQPFQPGDIVTQANQREVRARAKMTVNTHIMKLMGVNTLDVKGASGAVVRTPKLEIMLVLDVSGSMRGTKLAELKVAAKQFVTTMMSTSAPGTAVISIIPYSWGVTPSDGMFNALNVNRTHDHSTCLVFEDSDFNVAAIDTSTEYAQRIFTSVEAWSNPPQFNGMNDGLLSDPTSVKYNRTCFTDDYFKIMPYSNNEALLHAKIDSLQAAGSTSSHLGMKWAAGMLDPDFEDVIDDLQTLQQTGVDANGDPIFTSEVDPTLSGIPAPYDEPDTRKIIILMGDGQNDSTFMMRDPNGLLERGTPETHAAFDYRGPGSYLHSIIDPVLNTQTFYVFNPNNARYFPVDYSTPLTSAEFQTILDALPDEVVHPDTGQLVDPHQQHTWEDALGLISPRFVGRLTSNWALFNHIRWNEQTTDMKDVKMSNICDATKDEGVIVYSIGFQVDQGGNAETQLRACASESSKYYRAGDQGFSIADAFGSIAENVQQLRLTQ